MRWRYSVLSIESGSENPFNVRLTLLLRGARLGELVFYGVCVCMVGSHSRRFYSSYDEFFLIEAEEGFSKRIIWTIVQITENKRSKFPFTNQPLKKTM